MLILFALAVGACFGLQAGLLIGVLFDNWSRKAANWIMCKWFPKPEQEERP